MRYYLIINYWSKILPLDLKLFVYFFSIHPLGTVKSRAVDQSTIQFWNFLAKGHSTYRKVASSRPVYYSILDIFGQKGHYISIKFPLHKHSENLKTCY